MAKHKDTSQCSLILKHLKLYKEITPAIAYERYGVYRLGAIIFTLKKEEHNISSRIERFKKPNGTNGHYAVYRLED